VVPRHSISADRQKAFFIVGISFLAMADCFQDYWAAAHPQQSRKSIFGLFDCKFFTPRCAGVH
jgi:hypothetical protein